MARRGADLIGAAKSLLHPERGGRGGGTLDPETVILHLRGISPAGVRAQVEPPLTQPWKERARFNQLVALRRDEPGDVPMRAVARELAVARHRQ